MLHGAYLDRRGMCAQQDVGILFDEERVLHVARRVFGREVERREDMPVVLDFGSVGHGVAQAREDLDDFVPDECQDKHQPYGRQSRCQNRSF